MSSIRFTACNRSSVWSPIRLSMRNRGARRSLAIETRPLQPKVRASQPRGRATMRPTTTPTPRRGAPRRGSPRRWRTPASPSKGRRRPRPPGASNPPRSLAAGRSARRSGRTQPPPRCTQGSWTGGRLDPSRTTRVRSPRPPGWRPRRSTRARAGPSDARSRAHSRPFGPFGGRVVARWSVLVIPCRRRLPFGDTGSRIGT